MLVSTVRYIAIVIMIGILPISSANASPESAQVFVKNISDQVIAIIKSDKLNDSQKNDSLSKIFLSSVDTKWIGRFVLGNYWRTATEEQKNRYMESYSKYLVNSYVPKFKEYTDQQIKFLKSYQSDEGEFTVETNIISKDKPSVKVDYKIRLADNGQYKVFDVIAEGVSLITTQRSDFTSVISKNGLDDFINRLELKV